MYHFYSKPSTKGSNERVSVVGQHNNGMLQIAAARCSAKDQFSRKTGRAIAEKRLEENKTYIQIPVEKCDISLFLIVAQGVSQNVLKTKKVIR